MSHCSPIYLFVDVTMWSNHKIFALVMKSYENYTRGDEYDCALKSVPCDSNISRAIVFSDDYRNFVFWFDLFVSYMALTILIASGIFGNVVNIIIFSTTNISNGGTNLLLLATSVSDLLSCLVQAALLGVSYLCFVDVSAALSGYNILLGQSHTHNRWLNLLSLDLIAVLAVQRAGAVLIPFRASIIFSYRNTKITVMLLGMICFVTLIPFYIFRTPVWVFHPYFEKYVSLGYKYLIKNTLMKEYELRYSTNRVIIDMCVIAVAITMTVIKLNLQGKHRASLKEATNNDGKDQKPHMSMRERKAMRMSIAVCSVTFFVFCLVTVAGKVSVKFTDVYFSSPFSSIILYSGKLFVVGMCSFNFYLYITMSTQFRDAFKKMFKLRI